jgi:hypothetical protein
MQATDESVILDALIQFSGSENSSVSLDDQVKVMLVLRVCFESPKGITMPLPYGRYGGWLSGPAGRKGQYDMNWPVARALGRFYAVDLIAGYKGYPYDPVAEFKWFEVNGGKRNL